MSDDEDDDEVPTTSSCFFTADAARFRPPTGAAKEKMERKLANLPTIEDLLAEGDPHSLSDEQLEVAERVAADLIARNPVDDAQMKVAMKELMRKHKTDFKKSVILAGYQRLRARDIGGAAAVPQRLSPFLEKYLLSKAPRSQSGVLVVTVFTSAYPEDEFGRKQTFSCKWNCYYCLSKEHMQLLTSDGWIDYAEAKAAYARGALVVAGFEPQTQQIVYERPTHFVDHDGVPVDGMYEIEADDARTSLVVSGRHNLLVRGKKPGATAHVTVEQLLQSTVLGDADHPVFLFSSSGSATHARMTNDDGFDLVQIGKQHIHKLDGYAAGSWCVTMPSGNIVVRRKPSATRAYRPTVVGNCPNEPGQPRSYLLNEPGVRRANRLDFDAVRQFVDRVSALYAIGHPADKVELLVLGGTWESYPEAYRERFVRDLFYAANTIFEPEATRRGPWTLLEEQIANETAQCKIIGLTLETRPDTINPAMLVNLRRLGCTRVQLGVQHTDDSILSLVNREATRGDVVRAIRLLKDSCFKVDIHLMPDLPGSSPAVDRAMFDDVLNSPELQADQWKIYPCQTTPFSVIQKWYEEGRYRSYGLDELIEVLLYAKRRVHPWIRLNRVIRDIPVEYVLEGVEVANLRQLLQQKLEARGEWCKCIRCREVKGDKEVQEKLATAQIVTRTYDASNGKELFLSCETPTEKTTLFGFLRLRFPPSSSAAASSSSTSASTSTASHHHVTPFPELRGGVALIRELHVYGNLVVARPNNANEPSTSAAAAAAGSSSSTQQQQQEGGGSASGGGSSAAQHAGVGRRLLLRAEEIAAAAGYKFIAVISGVGVRNYYRKRGYELLFPDRGAFMLKPLFTPKPVAVAGLAALEEQWMMRRAAAAPGVTQGQDASARLKAASPECQRALRSCERAASVGHERDQRAARDQLWLALFLLAMVVLVVVAAIWARIRTGSLLGRWL